jgi:hypothetical protein
MTLTVSEGVFWCAWGGIPMYGRPGAVSGSPFEAPGTGMPEQQVSGIGTAHQQRWPLASSLESGALASAVPAPGSAPPPCSMSGGSASLPTMPR